MYLCYIDESGTSDIPGNSTHFILAGLSVPIWHWNDCDREVRRIKGRYALLDGEVHTAWMLRKYLEQKKIANFEALSPRDRRSEVTKLRNTELLRLQGSPKLKKQYRQTKKNYNKTNDYIHLTWDERKAFIWEVADCVSKWGFARLFAECIDKLHFDPSRSQRTIDEQAFEQVVSRFEHYLEAMGGSSNKKPYGLLIHDNNQTVASKHTTLMKEFHRDGTLWNQIQHIIETPLFVDSQLTGMVQIADLCSYAIRRYLEKQENELFDLVFQRADRRRGLTVGVRHFSNGTCKCDICTTHTHPATAITPPVVPP